MSEINENDSSKLHESIFDTNPSWRYNAFVEPDWGVYVLGYREAADSIVDQAQEFGVDLFVYPVMFLYRHYLEISLKHILIVLRRYFEESSELPTHHRLDKLWGEVRTLMEKEWNTLEYMADYDAIEARINEFHKIDKLSFSFRYPVTKGNVSSLKDIPNVYGSGPLVINLKQVKEVVHGMAMILDGTIDMVADWEEARRDYLDWIQQEYGESMYEY